MEEDSSAKAAPVTRLRRRLSVEPEDSPLPTTPSTPSKKRNTRLAAKPQLELIDEVASENVPKRTTRMTAVKEIESEATGTPTPVTPSRRSTRVRSNTSLLSETIAQSVESPRAKRALRRNSQLGSDNESAALITPARQTRRTRKGSTTSVDIQVAAPEENITVLTITSTEKTTKEETQKDPKTNKDKAGSPSIRKSPRLKQKTGNTDETDNIHIETAVHSAQDKNPVLPITPANGEQTENKTSIHTASPKENKTEVEMLSTSSVNLINDMKTSDIKTTVLNKSTTSIDKSINDLKNKRNRTKSWTTLTASPLNVGLTDEKEDSKEKLLARYRSISGSGDGIQNTGNSSKLEELEIKSPNKTINKTKTCLPNTSTDNKENIVVSEKPVEPPKTDTMKLFESSPMNQKPMVIIEDSDSGSYDKLIMDVQIEGEDQCVPVGKPANQTRKDSLEPMDIDETMPENVTIDDFSDKSNASKDEIEILEKRKSLISEKGLLNDKSMIKSKRKSSILKQASDTPPRNSSFDDKNKSTPKQHLDNTQNSSENSIENNKSRKNSVSFREEKTDRSKTDLETSQNESVKLTVNSPRKSSISIEDEKVKIQNVNDSKINQNKDEFDSFNKSTRKSSSSEDNIEKLDKSINKSKKNLSMSQNYCEIDQVEKSLNKSRRKSSTSIVDDNLDKLYESCNIVSGCQNKSEIKVTEEANNKSINKSQRKTSLSLSKENNTENLNEITNKSKRKSSNSETNSFVEENKSGKNANKSKRTSSRSQAESPMLEKSGNENKSTLVISQLKDVSTDDMNNVTSQNLTNNELSKSVNGPEIKNKAIDKINLSPKNYLTSTPIQQKSLQKMAMQINTSIISPAVENKNLTVEKTPKLKGIEEEINLQNKKKLSRALSSSASSDEETEPKYVSKLGIKTSPKNKPALESSESVTKTESLKKNVNKKLPKRVRVLDSSSDEESDIVQNQQKIPEKENNESKVDGKKVKTPNKNTPVSNSSDSEESEKEVSKDKNKMFDDEASEASDDYESGDSRNDEERQLEDDNEILEKGETLDSEEELSNDSDYERDSFIVSSDAEDNEMLSGTGDDLSMSDNELTMSAISKKKFNERKLKQQKKASREMYEARHKNESAASSKANTSKSKKSNRQRLESSTLQSENDSEQTKKNDRLRIDSSQDSANSADESIRIKKKKSKRLSESVCETTIIENEISLINQTTEKNDPLTAAIKLEPKTPQKGFNISTVAINDDIEEVQVDSNASIMKHSDTLDPLQATMAVDDEDDVDSLSEDSEIIENYDSVLNNLNLQTNKLKTHDTSLNLNKTVKIAKNPVIDQLNLTQTKKIEKNKNAKNQQAEPVTFKTIENVGREEEDSSDSIDMKLLFPDDSNDSDASKFEPEANKPSEPDTIIPLKRTEAKTNLLDKTDMNISLNESSLNDSKKKNKKRKTSQSSQLEESMILDNGVKIFVDTIGTHEEVGISEVPTNSSKKKNKKNKSLNETAAFEMAAEIDCTDGFTLTEVETSITSEKKKKKNKNKNFDESMKNETSMNVSGSHSEKKPGKKSQSTSDFIETPENREDTMTEEIPVNTSIKSEKKKKKNKDTSVISEPDVETQSAKKKSKKISISEENKSQAIHEETNIAEIPVNTSIKSEKKKKNKSVSVIAEPDVEETQSGKKKSTKISIGEGNESQAIHAETIMEEIPVNTSIKSVKKKKNKDTSVIAEPDVETQSAKKKSKKISISEENKSQAIHEQTNIEIPVNTSIKSEKKKKNKVAVVSEPDVETQSAKKKSKKISISDENKSQAIHDESDEAPEEVSCKSATGPVTDDAVITSAEKKFKKNKKKKNKKKSQSDEKLDVANSPHVQKDSELRKRKRNVSYDPTQADDAANVIAMKSVPTRNEKKKRKMNHDDDYAAAYDNNAQSNEDKTSAKKSKKDKSKKHPKEDIPQNNTKKRKNRENDDSVEKISKVSKQDSFDEIHVPRLPETLLKQLSEKPTKTKKISAAAISTLPFLVNKGGRKNKPSEYLEQSVYLNNSPVKKKKKVKQTNPKVLPFIPTALTSDSGCTSRFNISLLPKDTQFVAQASNVENFKEAFLGTQRIKKMGTLERCKIQRSLKLSKF